MQPLISVIVPVYRVENYLRKCVNSILNQTYKNLEVILVDDGSPDKCGEICDEYAEMDSRVRVIHKENGGLSSARNAGLEVMRGEYVGFVDSDDWIERDMFEYLLSGMSEKVRITVCNFISVTRYRLTILHNYQDITYTAQEMLKLLFNDTYENFACNKLFDAKLWKNLRFPEGRNFEDLLTIYKAVERSPKIAIMREAKYYYLKREDSISGNAKQHANRLHIYQAVVGRYRDAAERFPQFRSLLFHRVRRWYIHEVSQVIVEDEENRELNWDLLEILASFVREEKDKMYKISTFSEAEKNKLEAFSKGTLEGCKECLEYHKIMWQKK